MADPTTVSTYHLDNLHTVFDVNFDYLAQAFVRVTLIGETQQVLVLGTDYTFTTPTTIQTTVAYGPPNFPFIEVRRVTSATERLVEFNDASILHASDLNTSDLQVIHIAEEARDAATETLGVNNDGNLDARGRRIVNLADPIDIGDAVNIRWYQEQVDETHADKLAAEAAKVAAEAARDAALVSRTAADASQTASAASATSASGSASSASSSASSAAASKSNALTYRSETLGFRNEAEAFKVSAGASASAASVSAAAAAASAASVNDTNLVHKAGSEIITGDKTFTGGLAAGVTATVKHAFDVSRSVSGGAPASTGSAADPNVSARINTGVAAHDFGVYADGNTWQQVRSVLDYATTYMMSLNPQGGDVAVGAQAVSGKGALQATRKSVAGGSPASSGTTDANQIATIGNANVSLRTGMYASGSMWMQPSLVGNYASHFGMSLCPLGGSVSIGINNSAIAKLVVQGSVSYTIPAVFAGATGNGSWTTGQASTAVPLTIYASDRIFSAGCYTASDVRLKDNIEEIPLDGALKFCVETKARTFRWKDSGTLDTGFIAQELLEGGYGHLTALVPHKGLEELVTESGTVYPADVKVVARYEAIIPVLSAAISALAGKVERLEAALANKEL